MKKMNFFVMVFLCLCTMTIGFSACSDDDNNPTAPNLGTPPYEAVSGKYNVTTPDSPYESIELGASGNYIVTLSGGSYALSAQTAMQPGRSGNRLLANRTAQTRATQYGNLVYGTYTDLGNGRYQLEDFGTITLTTGTDGQVSGITVDSNRYGSATVTVSKESTMADSDMSNALCRTWRVERVHYVSTDLETGESDEDTELPGQYFDTAEEILFSKSGTYLVSYNDGSLGMARWRWRDEAAGSFYYTWEETWNEKDYATITFSGNTAVVYEVYEEDGYREESWYYLSTDIITDTPEEPQEPDQPQPSGDSPVAKVFGDKLIKTVSDDNYFYENGFLVRIAEDDDPESEVTFFHYNYVTGAEGPDVYTMDGSELEQTATLGENGFVASVQHEMYDCTTTFEYDAEGYITHIVDGREEREYELTWENGDLVQVTRWHYDEDPIEKSTYLYTYYDQPSNGIMRFYKDYNIDLDVVEEFYYAGLMGMPSRHLIETETSISNDYVVRYVWTDHDVTKYSDSEPNGRVDYTFSFYE
ncbi:MAG TPA: DUF4595 domain-containing protein [Candidatus Bacteroides merdipullorum]|uniref:DUF4595 domain-containing protein n=1 Tax=Candidatus Bacteroides merdipullorum TaxID=2838474 RepID=A0A9D2CWZ0_9BACE|nr:DUF4595 domain-containing protein [Candidatus Bacteroides merdipullorum]